MNEIIRTEASFEVPGDERAVIALDQGLQVPVVRGRGKTSALCGHCDAMLAERITLGQVLGIVLRCPNCGAFSDFNRSAGGTFKPVSVPAGVSRINNTLEIPPGAALIAEAILRDPARAWEPPKGFLPDPPPEAE